jgi:hypothetical protein
VKEDSESSATEDLDPAALQEAFKFAATSSIVLVSTRTFLSFSFLIFFFFFDFWQFVILIILVPLPLFFSAVVYGVKGFTTWVVIGILWTFLSAFTVVRNRGRAPLLSVVVDGRLLA